MGQRAGDFRAPSEADERKMSEADKQGAEMTAVRPGGIVTVFGASGFAGRHIVRALARRGYRVRCAVRRPNLAHFLRPMGGVGQVEPVQANIRDEQSCRRAIAGADAVINLVGLLYERGSQRFETVHVEGAARLARLAAQAGIRHFVHMSAIGADGAATSAYARSKAHGEAAVRALLPAAVVIRPSIIFGPEDAFFNRFAALARLSPVLPLIGGGETRFEPVYVKDVADAVAEALARPAMAGNIYELGGPRIFTFRELLVYILKETGRRRLLLPVPFTLARFTAFFLRLMPAPLLTPDQVELLKRDNVVSDQARADGRTLQGLGIEPVSLEAIVPSYLYRFRKAGQFDRLAQE